jgi:hypothetical protein
MIEAERRRTEAQVQERKRLRDVAHGLLLMPAKSRKQQKLLFAKFGEQWVKAHHFDKIEGLQKRSAASASKKKK